MAEVPLMDDFAATLDTTREALGMDIGTTLFEAGFTSMHVLKLKFRLDKRLCTSMPVIEIMKHPTPRGLTAMFGGRKQSSTPPSTLNEGNQLNPDDPVLIHAGVGEIHLFISLAQHIAANDRPVYAIRPPGFKPGHVPSGNIAEDMDTYVTTTRARQPRGPYAFAGYSYGAMLAFETAKRLDGTADVGKGQTVRFLGSFNLPPHIKTLMRWLCWNSCLVHLANFVGLATEDFLEKKDASGLYRQLPKAEALECIMNAADKARLRASALVRTQHGDGV
ncbi:hypothetical protein KVR01_013170 [Diaporthe batatas]|uniref:uncharacterized protein n=1 Tax=Diaporthe batatas TaxID=748121 RepID=UPI001D049BB3|nr:uncharacterized protein KVR01_013170 [Diaporthe batatas]KAG8156948.1 hypothetical protein KVR01_013170 [Diaporthe batatas]